MALSRSFPSESSHLLFQVHLSSSILKLSDYFNIDFTAADIVMAEIAKLLAILSDASSLLQLLSFFFTVDCLVGLVHTATSIIIFLMRFLSSNLGGQVLIQQRKIASSSIRILANDVLASIDLFCFESLAPFSAWSLNFRDGSYEGVALCSLVPTDYSWKKSRSATKPF